jgi:hypothetical protein
MKLRLLRTDYNNFSVIFDKSKALLDDHIYYFVLGCRHCFSAIFSLTSFRYATEFCLLSAFHLRTDFAFGHSPVRLFFEILLSACCSETRFGFSDGA